ncbi:MAG TPA: glycosyltransferase family 4 protein [Polyangiales bacterium]
MTARPIGYVMEQTLGNITHYLNLRRAEAPASLDPHRWIPIEFRESRLPWTLPASWATRRALTPIIDQLDGVFIHTMTCALGSVDLFARKPVVISCDGTPVAKRSMRAAYGLPAQRRFSELAKRELFRRVFRPAAGFVGWSNWAKESLVRDYGCREQDVAVIPPGIDLTQFGPGDRDHALPRILFVGGDFERKGGDLLLEVFRKHLRGLAELWLVTAEDVPEEPGVHVRRNLRANSEELRQLYATSDIFALPTRADCFAMVCMEALAAGLPLVTTRVGGIPDIPLQDKTGYLVDVDDATALANALLRLVHEPALRRTMSVAARADAEQRFEVNTNAQRLFEFVRSRC